MKIPRPLRVLLPFLLLCTAAARAGTVEIAVNGMVCSFCAQGIDNLFKGHEKVAGVKVELGRKRVTLEEKPGTRLSDE
jgi:hypothetical protein